MILGNFFGVGLMAAAIGFAVGLLVPHPRPGGFALTTLVGFVAGELGLLVAYAAHAGPAPAVGLLSGALLAAATGGLLTWRHGPYPPHERAPRTFDPNRVPRRGHHPGAHT